MHSFLAWSAWHRRFLLSRPVSCFPPSGRDFFRRQFDWVQVKSVRVDQRAWRVGHHIVAGQLDRSRIELLVAPGGQLAGKFGDDPNRVVGHLPAVRLGGGSGGLAAGNERSVLGAGYRCHL